ncbi:MAG: hypothetical protein LC135_02110 [Phycisphaerae bacterium]|nr:hypothetical protein [Phycisphaerae bacterium]MCZ2398648.1 hypothetical protein [Phycisphaerae bacterium]NUQ48468.1 hypothetical protein [Phycisphaerae bacterium]
MMLTAQGVHCLRAALAALACTGAAAFAAECDNVNVGLAPINDLGAGAYLGFQGGLYPNGLNIMPPPHHAAGVSAALGIVPRGLGGAPNPAGKIVLLSIGMSNTTQEYCGGPPTGCAGYSFVGQAVAHPAVNHTSLVLVDGARGGQTAGTWTDPNAPNYNRIRDEVLPVLGVTEAQVQAAWVKVANAGPTVGLPAPNSDAFALLAQLGDIVRALKARYPNLRVAFISSRIYAGYASTPLNPEPFAYESAFAVKWVIAAQIQQMQTGEIDPIAGDLDHSTAAPWIAWGAYLWADGLAPRSDGLVWQCSDLANDGTHPSVAGRQKAGRLLLNFMLASPHARPWFTNPAVFCPADLDGSGALGQGDLGLLLADFGCSSGTGMCPGDINGDGRTNQADLGILLGSFGAVCGR